MKSSLKVMLLIETSRAYGQGLLRGIAKYSRLHGPWTFYRESEFYRKVHRLNKAEFDNLPLDGLIAHVSSKSEAEYLFSRGIPVIIQCVHEKIPNRPTIVTDNVAIGEMAAAHLLERGFRHFAYYGLEDAYWSQERRDSFVKAVKEQGYDTDVFNLKKLRKNATAAQERQIIADWLDGLPKPLAVMACNDDRGQDIAAACRLAELRVPEEVIVIGVDNDELLCDLSEMPLSSIELATEKGGYEAAELLDQLMSGRKAKHKHIVVCPSRVVARRSTDSLAIEDLEVAEAVR
ncbi:MAG: XylR family transcriptional regulator, partial [Anaerohalosphaera sp.]|nr:XylR family transcriptional regulator [Anaerohalosphaera sp.]